MSASWEAKLKGAATEEHETVGFAERCNRKTMMRRWGSQTNRAE
ncbi:MAG: hypothetical protein AAFY84_12010 [Pseudomonadota bacterium]